MTTILATIAIVSIFVIIWSWLRISDDAADDLRCPLCGRPDCAASTTADTGTVMPVSADPTHE